MPLIKSASKEALSENIRTEMHHGKPQKQAVAIAFATQRSAKKHKVAKRMQSPNRHKEGGAGVLAKV